MRSFRISEQSEIFEMRREAEKLGKSIGFSEEDCGRTAIIATELATNILKHAHHGEILLGQSENASVPSVELLALDQGPGMADVDASFVDGHSTVGTHGTGLGAAKRQSSSFAVYSTLGHGTAIHVRVCRSKIAFSPRDKTQWAVVWRAMPGEELCGDGFCVREGKNGLLGLVVDGLGHGAFAAQAAQEAVRIFEKPTSPHVDDVVESIHQGLRATRAPPSP